MLSDLVSLLWKPEANKLLSPEDKEKFKQKLSALRTTVERMQTCLEKEEWRELVKLHYEMDDQADTLYQEITDLQIKQSTGV